MEIPAEEAARLISTTMSSEVRVEDEAFVSSTVVAIICNRFW